MKLVTAESCTGGMLSHWMTAFPGSSTWYECGFVTYSNDSKISILGVAPQALDEFGAVSVQVAEQMALGALDHSLANLAVSITGIAGPSGGTESKPTGTVYISSARKGYSPYTKHHVFHGDRTSIREQSASAALRLPDQSIGRRKWIMRWTAKSVSRQFVSNRYAYRYNRFL